MKMVPEQDKNFVPGKPRFFGWPVSRSGWWATGLGAVFAVLLIVDLVPLLFRGVLSENPQTTAFNTGLFMAACGLAAGVEGLIAVIRQRERSLLVWLAMLIGLVVLALLVWDLLKAV